MDSLHKLPNGAAFTNKSGTIRLTASMKGDSLHVTAESEGNVAQSYTEEENQVHIRNQQEQEEVIKEPVAIPFFTRLKWYLSGILTAIILVIIIKFKRHVKKSR